MTQAPLDPTGPPPDPDELPGGSEFDGFDDFWGVTEQSKVYLPDGKQYVVVQPMNEGDKTRFQKLTSRDVVLQQKTGDARMSVDPAGERHALIEASVKDWYMVTKDPKTKELAPVGFSPQVLKKWLEVGNPKAIEKVEEGIRKLNPWLLNDMTVEDIDEEIERLTEMKKTIQERELGEGSSATK